MSENLKTDSQCSIALYIHIPFCLRKCKYCSFVSYAGKEGLIPDYVESLKKEIIQRLHAVSVCSVYFGGGTPSLLAVREIETILQTIDSVSHLKRTAEITIEANPGTVSLEKLKEFRAIGINRLSLGVQSFNDKELHLLGRIHTADEAAEALHLARSAGFLNINVDLIYGVPGQTIGDWQNTLEHLVRLAPQHISLYALTLEEDTELWREIENGNVIAPDPDIAADQYEMAEIFLCSRSYKQYEIANWSQEAYRCRHNMVYWQCHPYLGVGVAAHSYLNSHRLANTKDISRYIQAIFMGKLAVEADEEIAPDLRVAEALILGLRLTDGIVLSEYERRYGVNIGELYHNQIEELSRLCLLEDKAGRLKLTLKGRLLGNEVFYRFLP